MYEKKKNDSKSIEGGRMANFMNTFTFQLCFVLLFSITLKTNRIEMMYGKMYPN